MYAPYNTLSIGVPLGDAIGWPPPPDCLPSEAGLSEDQKRLLGNYSWSDLTRGAQVTFLNFTAVATSLGMPLRDLTLDSIDQDRMFFTGAGAASLTSWLQSSSMFTSSVDNPFVGANHPGMSNNFRQDVAWTSMQVGTGTRNGGVVEIDIDYGNSAGNFISFLGHAPEVSQNRLLGRQTDSYVIADRLRARGVSLGHDCGKKTR